MLIGMLMILAYIVGVVVMEAVMDALFRALRWLVPVRTTDLGVVCWWLLSVVAGLTAVGWWQEDPTPVRLAITVLGCLCLAASGLAMTAAHTALAAERHAPSRTRISVSPARAWRRW